MTNCAVSASGWSAPRRSCSNQTHASDEMRDTRVRSKVDSDRSIVPSLHVPSILSVSPRMCIASSASCAERPVALSTSTQWVSSIARYLWFALPSTHSMSSSTQNLRTSMPRAVASRSHAAISHCLSAWYDKSVKVSNIIDRSGLPYASNCSRMSFIATGSQRHVDDRTTRGLDAFIICARASRHR